MTKNNELPTARDKELSTVWNLPKESVETAVNEAEKYRVKHGMFAGVPILCREKDCPYVAVCSLDEKDRIVGQRCPMEAGAIIARFEAWCKHFDIDLSEAYIKDKDLVDVSLIRDLVDNEIQTLRAENRIAINADFIGETISQIDLSNKPYYESVVSPEAEYKLKLQDKRYKILQLLNSTRKDKYSEKEAGNNPSQKAVSIFEKVSNMLEKDIDDIDFEKVENKAVTQEKQEGDGKDGDRDLCQDT